MITVLELFSVFSPLLFHIALAMAVNSKNIASEISAEAE